MSDQSNKLANDLANAAGRLDKTTLEHVLELVRTRAKLSDILNGSSAPQTTMLFTVCGDIVGLIELQEDDKP